MANFKGYESFIDSLNRQIDHFKLKIDPKDYGVITSVGDGIASVVGLDDVTLGEVVCYLQDKEEVGIGMVMGIEESFVSIMLFNRLDEVKEGMEIFSLKKHFQVPVGESLIGRVVDVLGNPIDDLGPMEVSEFREIESMAPGIMDRSSVCDPLQTGIKVVDVLIPIGLGQKQLILGDRQSGKSAIAIDTILNQKKIKDAGGKFTYCIYVAIGKKNSDIAKIYELFKKNGAMEYTIIVAANASSPAAMQYVAPMCGASIAEYFRDQGKDALVVFDDLSQHANAYREISLLMRRTPARGAYPGDIFYLHSRLLERAVRMKDELGGGSVTMLPIIETQAGDVSDYIPTNVISITDGQLYLDKQLFFDGQKPAINIGLSVSRIGSAAQYKGMRKIGGRLKGELAQFREYESFAKAVSDLDPETTRMIFRGRLLTHLFKQNLNKPKSFEKMVLIFFAGIRGLLDKVVFKDMIEEFENKLVDYVAANDNVIIETLARDHTFDDDMEHRMEGVIKAFLEQY